MKKIAALLSLIIFLFLTKSSANAAGYCNFSPEGANGQPYGDVTISTSCVIYESVNGTSLGNLTLQDSIITLNSTLVFSPGKQINIGGNSIVYINTNGKIIQSGLCIKDADGDGYADVITLANDPESGLPLTNPITQIGKVEANADGSCPSGYRPSDINVQNLTIVDADPLTPSSTTIATSDRELLRLGFMINGVTDALAAVGDIQIVNKNLLVCDGISCPADNFVNLIPSTGNVYVGGKVGIGTTNPIRKLDILTGTATEGIVIRSAADATNVAGSLWPGTGGFVIDSRLGNLTGAANLHLRTGGVDRIHISGATGDISIGGNVGIGTAGPGNKLDIRTSTSNDGIYLSNGTAWTRTYGGTLGGGSYNNIVQAGDNGIIYSSGTVGAGAFVIAPWASATSGIRMDGSGNVGIGTATPGEKLEVNGNIQTKPENSLPHIVLNSTSVGDNWTAQGAYMSIGEGGALASAAMHMTYTGDGYGYTGAGTVTAGIPAGGYWRYYYNTQNIYTPGTVTVGALTSNTGTFSSTVTTTGQMWINNTSPTIYFKDVDHRGAMLHNNSNLFYVLRGCEATQSTTWCTVPGGVWPFVINLETNGITTGGSITATSDIRLKTNIEPLPENTLDKVQQLEGVYFNWKAEADMGNTRQIGVIAQEVERIFPELVITGADGYKSVGYDRLGPILIEAIKEQQAEIDSLKSQVTDLKNELDEIKQFLKMPR